jgi:hypothetical protein
MMNPENFEKQTPGKSATSEDLLNQSSVLADIQALWQALFALGQTRFLLVALETRRAGESLVDMLVAGVMVAVLMLGSWLGLQAAAVLTMIEHGLVASSAILIVIAGNLLLALILCTFIRHKSHYLQFPATRRSLQPTPTKRQEKER